MATISSLLRRKPAQSVPLHDNTAPSNSSSGEISIPPAVYMGHATTSNSTMAQRVGPDYHNKSEAPSQLGLHATNSSLQSSFPGPVFFELCVNAGTFLKSLAEIDLKDTRTDGEFFQAVKEHYFRLRSYRSRFWLLKPSAVSYVRVRFLLFYQDPFSSRLTACSFR